MTARSPPNERALENGLPKTSTRKPAQLEVSQRRSFDRVVAATERLTAEPRYTWMAVVVLVTIHAALLAYSATRQSPTLNEPAHLVAGISHWRFGRFELFRVNPPLVRMIAAVPVLVAGYSADWGQFDDSPGARSERILGEEFITANGAKSIWLLTIARWACVPISVLGGLLCFLWSQELWRSRLAGLISLTLWCFDPNILAHGALITPDCAAAGFGMGAGYLFWRWLRQPTWPRAFAAGALLGLGELSKMTWIVLFGLWPILWLFWTVSRQPDATDRCKLAPAAQSSRLSQISMLSVILFLGVYFINLGYGFDGTLTQLKRFTFVSKAFAGSTDSTLSGNWFSDTWLGQLPIPLPKQYLLGIDAQKADFEEYDRPSYLLGAWKHGGWWYYYLCGLAVKTAHGSQVIVLLAVLTVLFRWCVHHSSKREQPNFASPLDVFTLLAPALSVLSLVSSQTTFNHHLRYVLPSFGFLFVLAGAAAYWFEPARVEPPPISR